MLKGKEIPESYKENERELIEQISLNKENIFGYEKISNFSQY